MTNDIVVRPSSDDDVAAIAAICGSETLPSIRLHAARGFTQIGVFPSIGFKFGRWIDSVYMQRALGAGGASLPQEIKHG